MNSCEDGQEEDYLPPLQLREYNAALKQHGSNSHETAIEAITVDRVEQLPYVSVSAIHSTARDRKSVV